MEVECTLMFEFESATHAKKVLRSVELENKGYIEAEVRGSRLVSRVQADSLESLKHTLDDYLACISVSEKLMSPRR